MELIDQHVKKIMEGCKERARDAGLEFDKETLEFIVTNQDMIELSPKIMIPTLYDYWVHDVEVIKDKGRYQIYPGNAYETVVNTRPAISFYNDNNPDWLNIMIFYHVLGHIDFFQNNRFFENTWNDDFLGKSLSDKREINSIREEQGENKRFVDYVIEFTRGIDNLVNFYDPLKTEIKQLETDTEIDYFFGPFLREKEIPVSQYMEYVERYNKYIETYGEIQGETVFFGDVRESFPEFKAKYKKRKKDKNYYEKSSDLIDFLIKKSPVLKKEENWWMGRVMQIVRDTSMYFQPQIRTKVMNEGWASYWHQNLFEKDDRISSHETDYAVVNAKVMSNPRFGLNPYAIGYKLFCYLYEMGERGQINNFQYQLIHDIEKRSEYNLKTGKGSDTIFGIRRNFNDFMGLDFLDDLSFQDFVTKNRLYVTGKRLNPEKRTWEYYIKSKKGKDYRNMIIDNLYHPPKIKYFINEDEHLVLEHVFEEKALYKEYIDNVLIGLEYLWGNVVKLFTTEFVVEEEQDYYHWLTGQIEDFEYKEVSVLYTCKDRKIERKEIGMSSKKRS